MSVGLVDTTIVIHLFRKHPAASAWLAAQPQRLSVTPITWLEVIYGAPNKAAQQACETILNQFDMVYLTQPDMDWAMNQLKAYRLSKGIAVMDCLIASAAYRLQLPLYTHNLKDMQTLLGALAVKPYL
jgi:predicted nucleic acid-binding protein